MQEIIPNKNYTETIKGPKESTLKKNINKKCVCSYKIHNWNTYQLCSFPLEHQLIALDLYIKTIVNVQKNKNKK